MEFSFLHISDIHLDRPFSIVSDYSFDENTLKLCKNALINVFNNITDYAILKNVDFVLIAGDTFDDTRQDFSSKLAVIKGFEKLNNADIAVYLVCGNHDPLSSYNKQTFKFDENSKTKIIGLNTPISCILPITNKRGEFVANLHALSFAEKKFNENPAKYFQKADSGFNIGLLHCDINADINSPYAPCPYNDLKELNYNYFALGHIHLNSENDEVIRYSGTVQGRNTKETGAHGIYYVKVKDNVIVKNSFIPMDVIRYENVYVDISSASNSIECLDIIEDKIKEKISNPQIQLYLIKLFISGYSCCFSEINEEFFSLLSEKIKSEFNSKVLISQIENSVASKADEETLKNDSGISGEIYNILNNEQIVNETFETISQALKSFIDNCNFTEEELNDFKQKIINSSKEEVKYISAVVYENNGIE